MSLPDNKDAVITIQGGGLYGLTLLGQLEAVVNDFSYSPLALAGTSAGAIVATLYWGGLTPRQIEKYFVSLVTGDEKSLFQLLSPFRPPPKPHLDFKHFSNLTDKFEKVITNFNAVSGCSRWRPGTWKPRLRLLWALRGLSHAVPHLQRRGFFEGRGLEEAIDFLLRQGLQAHERADTRICGPDEKYLRFRHYSEFIDKYRERSYRPPLLITATNLTRRRLEVISSVDPKYANVPIAKAVRASAGFPVFFTPQELPESPNGGWFVDGGVVSNFPSWVFSDAFRQVLGKSPIYRELVAKPWIRIGLRVVEDVKATPNLSEPTHFYKSLMSMLTGSARNQLEDILSSKESRGIIIKQPLSTTGGPNNFLDMAALDAKLIESMVEKGHQYARVEIDRIKQPSIYKKDAESAVTDELSTLISRCRMVLHRAESESKLRANVFAPNEDKLKLYFSVNMDQDGDRQMEFPDLQSGLTGFCYMTRRPQLCNLITVRDLRQMPEYANLFGMEPALQGLVRQDRTWLASVPIYDPYEVSFSSGRSAEPEGVTSGWGGAFCGIDTEMDGPLLGVLNIDAGWDYESLELDPRPHFHFTDPRIRAILALMQVSAFTIARAMMKVFPGEEDGHES